MPSASCFQGIIAAANVDWVGLLCALEHEARGAFSVLCIFFTALPGALGKARHWWQRSCGVLSGMVCCGLGRYLKFGHQQLVGCELPFGNWRLRTSMCPVIIPDGLETSVRDRRGVKQTWHVSRGNGRALMLPSHAGKYMLLQSVFGMREWNDAQCRHGSQRCRVWKRGVCVTLRGSQSVRMLHGI